MENHNRSANLKIKSWIFGKQNFVFLPQLSREYLERTQKNLEILQKTLDVGVARGDGRDDYSVYTGISGYSLFYLRLAQCKRDGAYLKVGTDWDRQLFFCGRVMAVDYDVVAKVYWQFCLL